MVIVFVDLLYLSASADSKLCFKHLKTPTSDEVKTVKPIIKWQLTREEENVWVIGKEKMR